MKHNDISGNNGLVLTHGNSLMHSSIIKWNQGSFLILPGPLVGHTSLAIGHCGPIHMSSLLQRRRNITSYVFGKSLFKGSVQIYIRKDELVWSDAYKVLGMVRCLAQVSRFFMSINHFICHSCNHLVGNLKIM